MSWLRRRRADPLAATTQQALAAQSPAVPPEESAATSWPAGVAGGHVLRMLSVVEEQRLRLDAEQSGEDDPDRLAGLYALDHGNMQVLRLARRLHVLAGGGAGYAGGLAASLRDVLRIATAMIEHYPRVRIGAVLDVQAAKYVAEDLALLIAELLDNATRFGGSSAEVRTARFAGGGVTVSIRDRGAGIHPDGLARINAWLAGPVWPVSEWAGMRGGLVVVHHLARRHGIQLNLAMPPDGVGTLASVYVPPTALIPAARPVTATPRPWTLHATPSTPTAPRTAGAVGQNGSPASGAGLPQRVPGTTTFSHGAAGAASGPAPAASAGPGAGLEELAGAWSLSDLPADPREQP